MDVSQIKKDFPIFENHPELVYLDSPATTLKPKIVIKAITDYYERIGASVHRGFYRLAEEATQAFEGARQRVRQYIGARSGQEIIFVRNTTEAINLVAQSWLKNELKSRDKSKVLLSIMEHHSNIVPWQLAAQQTADNWQLATVKLTEDYQLDMEDYKRQLSLGDVVLVAITQASNVLGTVVPVKEVVKLAHQAGARVLVDGAQAVAYGPVDVVDMDCDFYTFSGHKMLGPTGI